MNLTLDLGQSGARYKFGEEVRTIDIAKTSNKSLIQTVDEILKEIPKFNYDKVYLSLTGLNGQVKGTENFGHLCNQYFGSSMVCVMDDGVASYFGALEDLSGVVLTIGSGVVAVSFDEGKFGHSDGKGPIFGDLGGGFWIGQKGLQRAISTLDGTEDAFGLCELLKSELEIYKSLIENTGEIAMQLCIASAKKVLDAAMKSDENAIAIATEGARHLAKTVISAWKKVDSKNSKPYISIRGGLSKSEFYVSLIKDEISKYLEFEYKTGIGDHLKGASEIGEKFPDGILNLLDWWRI